MGSMTLSVMPKRLEDFISKFYDRKRNFRKKLIGR